MNINLVYRNKKPGEKPIFPEDIVRKAVADYFDENPILIPDEIMVQNMVKIIQENPEWIVNRDVLSDSVAQYFEETGLGEYLSDIEKALEGILEQIPRYTSQLENDSGFVTKEYVDNAISGGIVIPDSEETELDGATIAERLTMFLDENGIELNDIPTAMNTIMEHDAKLFNLSGIELINRINESIALEDESVANIIEILGNVQDNLDDITNIKKDLGDIDTILATLVDVGGAE